MTKIRHLQASCPARWLAAVLGLVLAGCGGSTGEVSGTVRFQGGPMRGGQVTFTSQHRGGVSAFAWIGENGSYMIRGCPTGPVKITVLPLDRSRRGKGFDSARGMVAARGNGQRRKLPAVPLSYTDPNTTELEYSVLAGPQRHNIELKP
jgi:hypothetical protein